MWQWSRVDSHMTATSSPPTRPQLCHTDGSCLHTESEQDFPVASAQRSRDFTQTSSAKSNAFISPWWPLWPLSLSFSLSELQSFGLHARPLPRFQVLLSFGDECLDPERQRRTLTVQVTLYALTPQPLTPTPPFHYCDLDEMNFNDTFSRREGKVWHDYKNGAKLSDNTPLNGGDELCIDCVLSTH